jgi:preprotein translocase subunit YajC
MISRLFSIFASLLVSTSAFADGPVGGAAGTGAMLVPFAVMFGIMYFLMIRPQQKKMKEQTNMLNLLKEGDEVLTASGILGTVKGITDRMVTLEVDRDVKLRILKTQVSAVLKDGMSEKLV